MDFNNAVKELGRLSCEWTLVPFLTSCWAIRNTQGQCPLEALADVPHPLVFDAMDLLKDRGLTSRDAIRIASAADAARASYTEADRHALLVACGLAPTEEQA